MKRKTDIYPKACYFALEIVNSIKTERKCNDGFVKKSISLKLINGGPNNIWGEIYKLRGCLLGT